MCLIRSRNVKFVIPVAAVFAAGCQTVLPPKYEPVALMEEQQPLLIDTATQMRDYDKQTVYYPNGGTESGSTRAPFAPREKAGVVERGFVEPVLFLANVVSIPVDYFIKPPFSTYVWKGAVTDPSYTVQPAYPTEPSAGTKGGPATPATPQAPADTGQVPPADAPVPDSAAPARDSDGGDAPAAPAPETSAPAAP